ECYLTYAYGGPMATDNELDRLVHTGSWFNRTKWVYSNEESYASAVNIIGTFIETDDYARYMYISVDNVLVATETVGNNPTVTVNIDSYINDETVHNITIAVQSWVGDWNMTSVRLTYCDSQFISRYIDSINVGFMWNASGSHVTDTINGVKKAISALYRSSQGQILIGNVEVYNDLSATGNRSIVFVAETDCDNWPDNQQGFYSGYSYTGTIFMREHFIESILGVPFYSEWDDFSTIAGASTWRAITHELYHANTTIGGAPLNPGGGSNGDPGSLLEDGYDGPDHDNFSPCVSTLMYNNLVTLGLCYDSNHEDDYPCNYQQHKWGHLNDTWEKYGLGGQASGYHILAAVLNTHEEIWNEGVHFIEVAYPNSDMFTWVPDLGSTHTTYNYN
ncbi:MAG: hypothetical protein ACXAEU_24215, partial [Candidatus Hodarchaeales archaeon]